jgi:peroxiredoxin
MSEIPEYSIGSVAPEFNLPASVGGEIALSSFRNKSSVYLFFVREFNWMQCRTHAAQLGRLYNAFKAANCEIVLILGAPVQKARQYAESLHLPFPVLADPGRNVYHLYGLEKAMVLIQRTASIIIDSCGTIQYIKTTTSPMLWLQESKELLKEVKSQALGCE